VSTITSANSSLVLTPRLTSAVLSGLLPALAGVGFPVQGYASDDAFATDAVDSAEARVGVDGIMSAGWLPRLTKQTITLQADSPSLQLFNALVGAQDALREVIFLDGVLTLPSVGITYALVKGVMTRITPIIPAKKVLEPVTYEITWGTVQPAPVV
jgi:hypothetical protein